MRITKFGHCCLLIEVDGIRVLTDPGCFSVQQDHLQDIDVILITHEHADHLHVDSLKRVLVNNPDAIILTNRSVGLLLDKEGITYVVIEDGQLYQYRDISFDGIGNDHAVICDILPGIQNTGYVVNDFLFYPGDAFTDPKRSVEVLALPVAGPWMKLSEAIEYAKKIKPKKCFPVHDGMLNELGLGPTRRIPKLAFESSEIEFIDLPIDRPTDF